MRTKNNTLETNNYLLFIDMTSYDPKRFAEWLKTARHEARLTIEELATRSGMSKQYISLLERAAKQSLTDKPTQPSEEKVDALARALNVEIAIARTVAGYAVPNQIAPNSLRDFTESRFPGADKLTDSDYELISNLLETFIKTKLKNK